MNSTLRLLSICDIQRYLTVTDKYHEIDVYIAGQRGELCSVGQACLSRHRTQAPPVSCQTKAGRAVSLSVHTKKVIHGEWPGD